VATITAFDRFAQCLADDLLARNYEFLLPDGTTITKRHDDHSNMIASAVQSAVTSAAFGLVAGMSGGSDKGTAPARTNDLKRLAALAQYVGMGFPFNQCYVAMILNADSLSNESLIGRFTMIEEEGKVFNKYANRLLRTWVGSASMGVVFEVAVCFSNGDRAGFFASELISKCRKWSMLRRGKPIVWPFPVDLASRRFLKPKFPPLGDQLGITKALERMPR
jgi:hypothetical protein